MSLFEYGLLRARVSKNRFDFRVEDDIVIKNSTRQVYKSFSLSRHYR